MNKSSTWTALGKPALKKLWIAAVVSGTCVAAAHDSGATWMKNIFRGAPSLISLISTPASLPFFLSTPPASGLADKVDPQKLICSINVGFGAGFVGKRWAAVAFEATVPFRLVVTPLVAKIVFLGVDAVDSIGGFYGHVKPSLVAGSLSGSFARGFSLLPDSAIASNAHHNRITF